MSSAKPKPRTHVPLKLRLKAWWDGCDVVVHARDGGEEPQAQTPARQVVGFRDPDKPWQTAKAKLACMLWGEGFSHPGDIGHVLELAKPFALTPAMTVVDLCAGLGGGARAIVEEFGVWVTGMEPDPELAEAGMQISTKAGQAKKAAVSHYDPENLDIRAGTVDCFLCRQLLHRVDNKAGFLTGVVRAIKGRGQLVITDYMLADAAAADSPAIQAWRESEPVPLHLATADAYAKLLAGAGLDVRVTEDMTAGFRSMVLQGWSGLTTATQGATLDPELVVALVDELERWTRRIAAFDSGALKLVRFYALRG